MHRPENHDRDTRIMALLHQTHDRVGQISLGVERLTYSHSRMRPRVWRAHLYLNVCAQT